MDRKEYDYIFDIKTYEQNVAGISAPRLFNDPYKIPAILFQDLVDNRFALNATSVWKDDNGNPIFWLAGLHNQSSGHFSKHLTNSNPGSCLYSLKH